MDEKKILLFNEIFEASGLIDEEKFLFFSWLADTKFSSYEDMPALAANRIIEKTCQAGEVDDGAVEMYAFNYAK